MIARAKKRSPHSAASACYAKFLSLLPVLREQARFAFRNENPEHRQDLIVEVAASSWAAFVRLVERGLLEVVYSTPLAQYAIKQVCDGRRVGAKLNVRDASSEYCRARKRITIERLDVFRRQIRVRQSGELGQCGLWRVGSGECGAAFQPLVPGELLRLHDGTLRDGRYG